jgi:hypothetical protein
MAASREGIDEYAVGTVVDRVTVVRWPSEADRRAELAVAGVPRLVVVPRGTLPPAPLDALEDWMWESADDVERRARADTLLVRWHAAHAGRPRVDDQGRIHVGGRSAVLAPRVAAVARLLVSRFDEVVTRDELVRVAWPDRSVGDGAVPLVLHRLRQRVAPLGLAVTSVRGRGVALVWTTGAAAT